MGTLLLLIAGGGLLLYLGLSIMPLGWGNETPLAVALSLLCGGVLLGASRTWRRLTQRRR